MEEQSFIAFWTALDAALQSRYDIDTYDMGLSADMVASYQEAGETPDEVALYYGRKFGLKHR